MSLFFDSPISSLHQVGQALSRSLKRLGINTVRDLLYYFPFRYEDFSRTVPIRDLRGGEEVTVAGRLELIANKRSPRKRTIITEAVLSDGTGQLRLIWFGQPFITKVLRAGDKVSLSGKVDSDFLGLVMKGAVYEKVIARQQVNTSALQHNNTTHTGRIVPIYSLTSGITQKQVRFLVSQIIPLAKETPDWLPGDIRKKGNFISLSQALIAIHFPNNDQDLRQAERRLKFDELFLLQLRAEMIRQSLRQGQAPALTFQEEDIRAFVQSLPYQLTKAQKIAAWEIFKDIERAEPMNRLLEGDVGSGKTVVAAMSLYNTVLNGYQGVLMAPTEILVVQHFHSLVGLLGEKVNIGLLTRSERKIYGDTVAIGGDKMAINRDNAIDRDKKVSKNIATVSQQYRHVLQQINSGKIDIIIGTHALLSEDVQFKNLGLVIVDEQHRFGVGQRKIIRSKSRSNLTPHFLSMTATPIPRSLSLTLYGDLDLSIINEMPPGRKPIITRLVDPHNREKAYQFIREQIQKGRQAFVICPLIQSSDKDKKEQDTITKKPTFVETSAGRQETNNNRAIKQYSNRTIFSTVDEKKSVLDEYTKLSQVIFPDFRVGYLHGKLKAKEKDEIMKQFADRELDILVSTSVVEVGVDIPNASVMMIEGAQSFGLAQLHQFRGRVGRSDHQSYCFLFTDSFSEAVRDRLEFFASTTDGFKLAEYDLQSRGPGDVYGTAQSGMMEFRLATTRDVDLIRLARDMSRGIDFNTHPSLKEKVEEWEKQVHLE